jgi:hypothetical protein
VRFFKRGASEPESMGDFWAWWSAGRDRVAQAISTGGFDERLVAEIARAVSTIHPAMAWELAPGRTAQHAFCVSPEGNAEIRQATLRWLGSAPPPDATWEYHASKQAAPKLMGLQIGNLRFDLEEMRAIASWDGARRRLDVRLWHPRFEEAPAAARIQAGFVFLDHLLGEEDVERWIGAIDLLESSSGGLTPAGLKADLERRRGAPAGDETWVLGERTGASGRIEIVRANAALKRIDHPFADHHVEITTVLPRDDTMPTDTEVAQLDAEEMDFLARLGGIATYAGRTTAPGQRTMHLVAEEPDGMRPAIDAWAAGLPDSWGEGLPPRRLKVNFERDVDWSFQRELLGG